LVRSDIQKGRRGGGFQDTFFNEVFDIIREGFRYSFRIAGVVFRGAGEVGAGGDERETAVFEEGFDEEVRGDANGEASLKGNGGEW